MAIRWKNNLHPHRGDTFVKHGQVYQTKPRRGETFIDTFVEPCSRISIENPAGVRFRSRTRKRAGDTFKK